MSEAVMETGVARWRVFEDTTHGYWGIEESNETCQALGMTEDEAIALVQYTYGRPAGEPAKEIGAAALTLASLCVVAGHDMMACAEADLEKLQRPETIERIRAKRATRHGRGPLPGLDPVKFVPVDRYHYAMHQMEEENERLKRRIGAFEEAARKTVAMREALFGQCASNPVYNAWGNLIDMTTVNEATVAADAALQYDGGAT